MTPIAKMKQRKDYRRLVLATLRSKGPLTDAELAWIIRVALDSNPHTAVRKRWQLTKAKEIRFARLVRVTESGRLQKMWEVTPMRTIRFSCTCGRPLVAELRKLGPGNRETILFFDRKTPPEAIAKCPNCQRDFSKVTADEFLSTVWPGG